MTDEQSDKHFVTDHEGMRFAGGRLVRSRKTLYSDVTYNAVAAFARRCSTVAHVERNGGMQNVQI